MAHRVFLLLFGILFLSWSGSAVYAQGGRIQTRPSDPQLDDKPRRERDSEEEEMVTFKDHLWYGGSFDLGFGGSSNYSSFILGINPMVGYKILPALSIGPRVGLQYNYLKGYNQFSQIKKVNLLQYSLGAFVRYKVFRNFFAQGEYEFQNYQNFYFDGGGDVVRFRQGRDNMYLGAGYNSGGKIGTELALMYNLLEPAESTSLPFSIRFGITYKF